MADLVTIAQARAHLRLDSDSSGGADDDWLAVFIPAISEAVSRWVKESWRLYVAEVDSSGDEIFDSAGETIPVLVNGLPVAKPVVVAAVLVELDNQYRFRGGESEADVPSHAGYGYVLNKTSTALLAPLRKSTVA